MPVEKEELPDTLKRSPKKVRRTYEEALDSAHEQYDSEERAHRTAWSAVKHIAEKRGDHWELKDEPGPSDPQAAQAGPPLASGRAGPTAASTSRARRSGSCMSAPATSASTGART
ncbi:MAG TPA: ChaB family protein [Solirubrobacteraceae bacterium]|nr:ChaB family protein [Solirubrobacteraceae bacterium]